MRRAHRLTTAATILFFAAACRDTSPTVTTPQLVTDPSASMSATGEEHAAQEALDHAVIHQPVEAARGSGGGTPAGGLYYHGGVGGIGVESAPRIYLVVWGSQWRGNDPSGEVALLQAFYGGIGTSPWLNSVTQYCQGITSGSANCATATSFAGNPAGIFAGTLFDTSAAAPAKPTQSQIAAEAVRAAQLLGNTTAASNASVQYVIATSTGHNSSGFKTQYCAYHSSTSSAYGNIAYTNLPYITDAGASCGANFNGLGAFAGITIVSGHEAAETITDQFPNGGWLDSKGAENGDKCAWTAATGNITLATGTFAVQPLWSNASGGGSGSCVLAFP